MLTQIKRMFVKTDDDNIIREDLHNINVIFFAVGVVLSLIGTAVIVAIS